MMTLKTTLEELLPTYLEFWKKICNIETPSYDKTALNKQSDVIEAFCLERGFSVERQQYPNAGDTLLITLRGDGQKSPVALLAHMDTVHAQGAFGYPPVREEKGILYGPGVFDCKGGIACCLLAMDTLSRVGSHHRTVKLILNSDEEDGSFIGKEGVEFIHREASGACAAFNAEAGRDDSLTVGRKGIVCVEIQITGIAGHAGNAYFSSASAIREAAYKIIDLESQSDADITFNCGIIRGGKLKNIVPDTCEIVVDIRFKSAEQQNKAIKILEKVVQTNHVEGCGATWRTVSVRHAMESTHANLSLFEKVMEAADELGLPRLLPMERGGGSDSAYTVEIGVPTVCSMGPIGHYEHTVREEADIASLRDRALMLASSILKV